MRQDPQLLARAQQLIRDQSPPVPLRDLAAGDWDRVHAFPGPPSRELIESDIGAPLEISGPYTPYEGGGVLVFTTRDIVQRALWLDPYPFDDNIASYNHHVLVQPPYPGARWLEFVENSPALTPTPSQASEPAP